MIFSPINSMRKIEWLEVVYSTNSYWILSMYRAVFQVLKSQESTRETSSLLSWNTPSSGSSLSRGETGNKQLKRKIQKTFSALSGRKVWWDWVAGKEVEEVLDKVGREGLFALEASWVEAEWWEDNQQCKEPARQRRVHISKLKYADCLQPGLSRRRWLE